MRELYDDLDNTSYFDIRDMLLYKDMFFDAPLGNYEDWDESRYSQPRWYAKETREMYIIGGRLFNEELDKAIISYARLHYLHGDIQMHNPIDTESMTIARIDNTIRNYRLIEDINDKAKPLTKADRTNFRRNGSNNKRKYPHARNKW